MGFETSLSGPAPPSVLPAIDRAPKSHRHGSWIERLLASTFRTFVEGFAL